MDDELYLELKEKKTLQIGAHSERSQNEGYDDRLALTCLRRA
jgi:hypothetical protein